MASCQDQIPISGPCAEGHGPPTCPPSSAETSLIAACRAGRVLKVSSGEPSVRATLLRLRIAGGTADCGLHKRGVGVIGATIAGQLDLSFLKCRGAVVLDACRFDKEPLRAQAEILQLPHDDRQFSDRRSV